MAIQEAELIWRNGEWLPWKDATVHVLAHGLHYGTSVFEGIRAYKTSEGVRVFRLEDHLIRLEQSARIHRIALPYDRQELTWVCGQLLERNGLENAYIRPIVYLGYGSLAVMPSPDTPVDVAIAAFPWGALLGEESRENGVTVGVSSWQRSAPNTMPAMAKAGGNYLSSRLITMEAVRHGYTEGIALDHQGYLSEGAGENLFLVKDSVIYTPSLSRSILAGITRDSVIKLAGKLGYEVREETLPREFLYLADELFFTGTAAEVVPIRAVDGMVVGHGSRGPVTKAIQDAFFGLLDGSFPDTFGWLEAPTEEVNYSLGFN